MPSGSLVWMMSTSPVSSASACELGVEDRLKGDGVEVRVAAAPVVGVPIRRHVAVGHPVLEDEGPGADRVGRAAVGGAEHGGRSHVSGLRLGQVIRERRPGVLQGDCDRQWPGHRGALDVCGEGGPGQDGVRLRLDVLVQRLAVQRGPVVEDDVGPQRDREFGVVGVGGDRLGQVGLDFAGGGHDGDGVEDGAAVEEATLVPAGGRGVEAALLRVDAHGHRAPPLGRLRADAVQAGPVGVTRTGDPVGDEAGQRRSRSQGKASGKKRPTIECVRHRNPQGPDSQ